MCFHERPFEMKTLQDYIIMHHEETSFLIRRQVFLSPFLLPLSMMKRPETESQRERQSFPGKERKERESERSRTMMRMQRPSQVTRVPVSVSFSLPSIFLLSLPQSLQPGHSLSKSILLLRKRENEKERRHPVIIIRVEKQFNFVRGRNLFPSNVPLTWYSLLLSQH